MTQSRALAIVCGLGFVLSLAGLFYAVTRYLGLEAGQSGFAALASVAEAPSAKITSTISGEQMAAVVTRELNHRRELYLSLHQTLIVLIEDAKKRALTEALLWLGAVAIFVTLLLGTKRWKEVG